MAEVNPVRGVEQRQRILDAAVRCFRRHGFHASSMQQICAEAQMSPGALYRYFPGKEAIIAAIAEQEVARCDAPFARLGAADDVPAALLIVAEEIFTERSEDGADAGLYLEVTAEAARNPAVAGIVHEADAAFWAMLQAAVVRAQQRGGIDPRLDAGAVTLLFSLLLDGLAVRYAMDPAIDRQTLHGALYGLLSKLVGPTAE